jgi:hypothetical protein
MNKHDVSRRQWNRTREGVRRGGHRRERMKRESFYRRLLVFLPPSHRNVNTVFRLHECSHSYSIGTSFLDFQKACISHVKSQTVGAYIYIPARELVSADGNRLCRSLGMSK